MATALDKDDYRVYWIASDCTTCIAGITDAGLLETLAGFSIDIDFSTGYAITVDIDVPLASDTYVQGIDVDLQQSAGYTDTWSTAGGMIGIRSDVHVDFVVTDAYAGYFNVYVDPAATCTLNDMLGVFGRIVLVGPVTAGAATSQVAALRGSISNSSSGSYDGQVFALSLDFGSNVTYGSTTAMIYAWTHADARCDYGFYLNNYSPYMTTGILLGETAGASPAMVTGIAVIATVDKGIDFTDATLSQSWDNAFIAIGSGNGSAGDQHSVTATTHYIPVQVNVVSIANPTGVSELSAAMLRFDADTADQANASIDVLTIRSDIAKNVYAATCINASLNISDDIAVPTATVQGIFVQITGDKEITCPNTVSVLEAAYKQTAGGGGVDNVGSFVCNATGCVISNVLWVKNYGGTVTNGILVDGAFTAGIAVTGTVDKGIDFTDATLNQGWNNGFFAVGSGNGATGDQHTVAVTDFYIPIQVNMVSTAGPAAPSEVCAAMLRVDASTADQGNSSVDVLCIRSDIAFNVYAASCINASLNISDDISVPTATVQGIYVQITGDGIITCPNTVNVLEAVYKQTAPGDGVDNVGAFVCNATGCTITNILWVKNYGGTVTNGILVDGAFATGINLASSCTIGMAVGACTTTAIDFGLTVGTLAGDGNAALIRGGYAATGGHTTPSDPIAFVTANQHAMQFYLSSTTGKFTGIEINAYTSDIATDDDSPTCAIEAVGRSLAVGTGTNSIYGIRAEAQALALKYGPRSSYELIAGFFKTGSAIDGVVGGRTICAKLDLGLGIPSGEGDYGLFIRNNSEGLIGAGPTRVASTCQAVHFDGGYANVFSFGEVMNVNYGDAWSLTGSGGEGHIRCQMWNGAAYVTKYIRLYNA